MIRSMMCNDNIDKLDDVIIRRYDHANEERYGGAIEALDEAGKTGSAEALAAARWRQRQEIGKIQRTRQRQ